MNEVTFKTLDTAAVHEKLIRVGERIAVVSEVIDKWNDCVHCAVLPILKDADYELGEVFNDLQLNGQEELSKEELDELGLLEKTQFVFLDEQTTDQPETVVKGIEKAGIKDPTQYQNDLN